MEDILDIGRTKRWHTWPIIGQETIAEHQWQVAMILLKFIPDVSKYLLMAALTHDLVEDDLGDIPCSLQHSNKKLYDDFKEHEEILAATKGYAYRLTESEKWSLKAADMLAMYIFSYRQRALGNQYMDRVIQMIEPLWDEENYPKELTEAKRAILFRYKGVCK